MQQQKYNINEHQIQPDSVADLIWGMLWLDWYLCEDKTKIQTFSVDNKMPPESFKRNP